MSEEHIKQNASGLYLPIQKIGCFFRSCGLVAEYITGRNLTIKQLNDGWNACKQFRYIDSRNNVQNSEGIINYFLKELDDKGNVTEVATFEKGYMRWYNWVREGSRYRNTLPFMIQKIFQRGPSATHFRVVNKRGELVEDPHAPAIEPTAIVYSIAYHYDGSRKE